MYKKIKNIGGAIHHIQCLEYVEESTITENKQNAIYIYIYIVEFQTEIKKKILTITLDPL